MSSLEGRDLEVGGMPAASSPCCSVGPAVAASSSPGVHLQGGYVTAAHVLLSSSDDPVQESAGDGIRRRFTSRGITRWGPQQQQQQQGSPPVAAEPSVAPARCTPPGPHPASTPPVATQQQQVETCCKVLVWGFMGCLPCCLGCFCPVSMDNPSTFCSPTCVKTQPAY